MNDKIISGIKKYVNQMMGPLEDHYYHQYEHALEVSERSLEVGKKEGLSEQDLELLYIASLFHDVGFVIQYDNNEIIRATIAKNYLKSILYPEDKIKIIEELIIATTLGVEPKTLLEKIIKDADMDNLGRVDFFEKGEKLKHELELIKKIKILDPDWSHYSLNLLKSHNFYTNTGINERNGMKFENIKILENKINN